MVMQRVACQVVLRLSCF